jgi:hypothetical protein
VRCRTAHLALSIFNELGLKLPFLGANLETRPSPLLVMASGGDRGKAPLCYERLDWCRPPNRSHVVAVKLQGQLFAQEREQDSREGALVAWENSLASYECALERVRMKRNAECD